MSVELRNPDTLPKPDVYAQLSIATGSRLVFISGQVAYTSDGTLIGRGDLAAQAEQVYTNLHAAVTAAGGTFADIAKLTIYVVDYEPSKIAKLGEGAMRAATRLGFDLVRPVTLLGVSALGEPELLVEVEATAVLP